MLDPAFDGFARGRIVQFGGRHDPVQRNLTLPADDLPPDNLANVLGAVVGATGRAVHGRDRNIRTSRISSTAARSPISEDRIMVPSPNATYDLHPDVGARID
jgi:hypothetical protein